MRKDLYFFVKDYIRRENLIRPGEAVAAGVSGGADSVCLLLILERLSREWGFYLCAVHVHHGLRESADADRAYVEELCGRLGIPLHCFQEDAAAAADSWGTGIEEAGRRIRHEAFEKVCRSVEEELGGSCLAAVAHHIEDQAETVLFHLCRGTDLRGLRGMEPRNGRFIRPLLEVKRGAIEAYLQEMETPWRTDETNADTAYTRNFLRAEILPRLHAGVNTAAADHIARFARTCAETEAYLDARTREALNRCLREPEATRTEKKRSLILSIPALLQEDPLIRGRILYQCLAVSAGTRRDLQRVHIEDLTRLCEGEKNGSLSLPGGVEALRSGGELYLYRRLVRREEVSGSDADAFVSAGNVYPVQYRGYSVQVMDYDGNGASIPRKRYTKWFDYDKIGALPVFRTRQPGDRMTLLDPAAPQGKVRKKLARVMLDAKIPSVLRDRLLLPFAGQEALWIPGVRMSDRFRVGPETRKVVEICWDPGRGMNESEELNPADAELF